MTVFKKKNVSEINTYNRDTVLYIFYVGDEELKFKNIYVESVIVIFMQISCEAISFTEFNF